MKNPLIYSLSTVGILKHYNQDYLIHPQRTDFTGSNGVGKSIIADLFQLIFINDRQLFQFGTEGYKKEVRQIHKLAYRCRDAYAFLTIEVDHGKFICLGVCIPNTTNRPLRPFLITSDPDSTKDFKDRAFPIEKIPTHANFINEAGQIYLVDELSKKFRDKYGLYFESFSTRDKKDEHYENLFDRDILPINLSIQSSLKAFAKIIQSFSRARSEGDKSDALKEFLFDGNEKELEESFESHKTQIDKLLLDFEDLQNFINDLERKQETLDQLKTSKDKCKDSGKEYLIKKTGYYLTIWNKVKSSLSKTEKEYSTLLDKVDLLEIQVPRMKALSINYKGMYEYNKERLEIIKNAKELDQEIIELKSRISALDIKDLPTINESLTGLSNIDDFQDNEVIKYCKELLPIYNDYKSLSAVAEQLEKQMKILDDRKKEISTQTEYLQMVNKLFVQSGDNSLIEKVLKSNLEISIAQEAVLFHFIKARWQKPYDEIVDFFAEGFEFLATENITKDENLPGYWYSFKDLSIYIKPLAHSPILNDSNLREKAISEMLNSNDTLLKKLKYERDNITAFERGIHFDIESVPFLSSLDKRLKNYAIQDDLNLTIQLALQLKDKIEKLKAELKTITDKYSKLLHSANIKDTSDLTSIEVKEADLVRDRERKYNTFKQRYISDDAKLSVLKDTTIPTIKRDFEEKQQQERTAYTDYIEKRTKMENSYDELLGVEVLESSENEMRETQTVFTRDQANYESLYRTACENFDETKSKKNLELTMEIEGGNYNFDLLERILLGKIHFKDQISEELRTANRSRHNLIDSIHETMLKIFAKTKNNYDIYERQIRDLNLFFKGRKISKKYYFQVEFLPSKEIPVNWITDLQSQSQQAFKPSELPMGKSVESFVEDFFKKAVNYKKKMGFKELLDPRTYFNLDAGLLDENGNEISGSTGETYTAKVLLGIGRLSKIQSQNRTGIRFIILEETANLDKTNFNNFPEIADEFDYQIITMTPKPFGSDSDQGWYLHHLLPGKEISEINYPIPSSYFKTNLTKQNLLTYLNNQTKSGNELDSTESS